MQRCNVFNVFLYPNKILTYLVGNHAGYQPTSLVALPANQKLVDKKPTNLVDKISKKR